MSMSRSRVYKDDRLEAIKTRLNASNIIREEHLSQSIHSRREPGFKSSVMAADISLPHQGNPRVGDLKGRVERELTQGVKLATNRKELLLLIEDQADIQARLREDYARQIDQSRAQVDLHLKTLMDHEKNMENILEKLTRKQDENSQLESELTSIAEENRSLESEIKRLSEKTANKMGDMQTKM